MNMKLIYPLMLVIALLTGACQSTRVYLVRHAEKATQPTNDPDLIDTGKERAQDLAALLADKNIKAFTLPITAAPG